MEELAAKYEALYRAVLAMRDNQIKSERYRASEDRARYLRWQRVVDDLLKKETKERNSKQAKIF